MTPRLAPLCLAVVLATALAAATASAQATANTSYGYAQVLRVEPVYAIDTVEAVDPECLRPDKAKAPPARTACGRQSAAVRAGGALALSGRRHSGSTASTVSIAYTGSTRSTWA